MLIRKVGSSLNSKLSILLIIFLAGAAGLVIEMVALRVLAPYFGNTIFVTSSVISAILGALATGYAVGGRLADRRPEPRLFNWLVMASGLSTLTIVFLSRVLLPVLGTNFSIVSGPPVAALLLFFLPAFLLGFLPPFAIRLLSLKTGSERIGETSGQVFFWSTVGSIGGALAAAYLLIPHFSTEMLFYGSGVILFLLGLVPSVFTSRADRRFGGLTALIALLVAGSGLLRGESSQALYDKNGSYERITIFDGKWSGRPVRFLRLDQNNSSARYLDGKDHVFTYTEYYQLAEWVPHSIKRALVLGGGAYTIPEALLNDWPDSLVDVVDIEPTLYELAQTYFGLKPTSRLRNIIADGRRFLRDSNENYDFIFSDVYYSLHTVPAHLTTEEFFHLVRERLSPGGIFVANLIGSLDTRQPSFVPAEIKTFQQAFPSYLVYAANDPTSSKIQNIILVGINATTFDPSFLLSQASQKSFWQNLASHQVEIANLDLSVQPVLTDRFAPVEYYMARTLR